MAAVLFPLAAPTVAQTAGNSHSTDSLTPSVPTVSSTSSGLSSQLELRLSGDLELSRLVELVSERLGVSVQYQASDLNRRVTLRLREALSDAELWSVLVSTLESQSLAIAPTDAPRVYRVAPLQQALAQGVPLRLDAPLDKGEARDLSSVLTTIVRVRHMDPARAADAVKPLLSQQAVARPVADGSGLLLLADARSRVEQALALLAVIDQAGVAPELPGDAALVRRIVELSHLTAAQASELAQRVLAAERAALSPTTPGSPAGGTIASRAVSSVAGTAPGAAALLEIAPGVQAVALPGDNRLLIMSSSAGNAERVASLLRELDVAPPIETRGYSPPSPGIRAPDLATTLRELLTTPGSLSPAASSSGGASGAGGTSGGGGVKVYADALTGSVFVTGTLRDHARVESLLASLRDAPPGALRELRSFVIKNRDAREMLATLESLVGLSVPHTGSAATGALGASDRTRAPGAGASPSISPPSTVIDGAPRGSDRASSSELQSDQAGAGAGRAPSGSPASPGPSRATGIDALGGVTLSIDAPTNTILAAGSRSSLDELSRLIERLDKRQPQVLLEATLISLSESQALSIGVELTTMFRDGSTSINLSSLFGLATGTDALPTGSGLTGLVVNPGDFQVLVRALEQVNRGRSTSAPKVLVNNNATATLRSVNRQPFTSINASDNVATTSFGGTQDAGTTLTVTPRIAEGDHLSLEYSIELSAFTGEPTTTAGGGVIPPPSQQSSVQGQVTIPDGYTIALGGLRDLSDSKGTTRVPILGSLPIIGQLFRVDSKSGSESRFYVFLRATVLRDPGFADLRALSAPDLAHAGVSDGEPALSPIWIDGRTTPQIDPWGEPDNSPSRPLDTGGAR